MHKVENAIIVAAGKGERMKPLTDITPKPLLKVFGKPIIENTIEVLLRRGIESIYIVIGYKEEQFQYLSEKYPVTLIVNPDYDTCNNISSLYCARNYLCNSVILDADIWIENDSVIKTSFDYSGYTSLWTSDYSDEWIQYVDKNSFVQECSRGGANGWILYSISYWSKADCESLKKDLVNEFITNKNTQIYWDDIPMFCCSKHYVLQIKEAKQNDFTEFDSIKELAEYDRSYQEYL